MISYYLNSYVPLVASKTGRAASIDSGILPFVDGSIRREPDLEHEYPSISCLCRAGKFAPRLQPGDVVGYRTNKMSFGDGNGSHMRLTAVLQIQDRFANHEAAAGWYRDAGLPLPSNCMTRDNPAKPLQESHRLFDASACAGDARTHRDWDLSYQLRARQYPVFLVCRKLWCNLEWSAPILTFDDLIEAFGYRPSSHNPGRLERTGFQALLRRLDINIDLP